jgi:hypothetical protein
MDCYLFMVIMVTKINQIYSTVSDKGQYGQNINHGKNENQIKEIGIKEIGI